MQLRLDNYGSSASESLSVTIELDDFFEFVSSSFEVLEVNGNQIVLGVDPIERYEFFSGNLVFRLNCEAPLGIEHYTNFFLTDYDNPCYLLDTETQYFQCMPNIGSWDPNDKISFVDGFQSKEIIDSLSTIEYMVRFQNTGSDTAFNVKIIDDLPDYFDKTSIKPLVASHDFEWHLERSVLVIDFPDIKLVDSTSNEKDSHGFVKFQVDLEDDVAPGALIENEARIYFDFNEPIITNKTENYYLCNHGEYEAMLSICEGESYQGYTVTGMYLDTLTSVLGCDSIQSLYLEVLPKDDSECLIDGLGKVERLDIKAYPNPLSDKLYLLNNESDIDDYRVSIYSISGIQVYGSEFMVTEIDLSYLVGGIYMLEIIGEKGRYLEKVVVR